MQTEGLIEREMEEFDHKTVRLNNEAINGCEFERNVGNDDSLQNKRVIVIVQSYAIYPYTCRELSSSKLVEWKGSGSSAMNCTMLSYLN